MQISNIFPRLVIILHVFEVIVQVQLTPVFQLSFFLLDSF